MRTNPIVGIEIEGRSGGAAPEYRSFVIGGECPGDCNSCPSLTACNEDMESEF